MPKPGLVGQSKTMMTFDSTRHAISEYGYTLFWDILDIYK